MSGSGAIPRVCVIVLNCDGLAQLDYCLPSLAKTRYAAFEVIVVDNASADGSPEWVERTHPEVALLRSHRNLGWAGGNNLGIALAHERGAEYVALLNDDVRVDPRWIGAALEAAGSDPWIGIVGFRIIEGRGGDLGPFERALAEWSGRVVRAGDAAGLAEALAWCLDAARAPALRAAARAHAERSLCARRMARDIEEIYREIAD